MANFHRKLYDMELMHGVQILVKLTQGVSFKNIL